MREQELNFGTFSTDNNTFVYKTDDFYTQPAQEYNIQSIPGKNGDLLMRNKRYPDVPMTFTVIMMNPLPNGSGVLLNRLNAMLNGILSQSGYQKLVYGEALNYFYMAYLSSNTEPIVTNDGRMCKFDLTFMRKPQRFLSDGDRTTSKTAAFNVVNPTLFESSPWFRVYGDGVLTVNDETITITEADEYTDIDCEIMEAYKDTYANPKNEYIQLSGVDFPKFKPGSNSISWTGNITQVQYKPRWWRL